MDRKAPEDDGATATTAAASKPSVTSSIILHAKAKEVGAKLQALGVSSDNTTHDNIIFALENNYSQGKVDKAVELMVLFDDSVNGKVLPIAHSDTSQHVQYHQLLGADNRNGVTCYLDSLLFSMFARLESFEPMLTRQFEPDSSKANLATFLRFYVNLMRSGKLITTDVTKTLLNAIQKAGWTDTCFTKQQDVCELFNFISDALDMPMITLKLDIEHGGKKDDDDDHKLINERMLLVSVPPGDDNDPILLEQCLESYFANSINVRRQLERRKTLEMAGDLPTRTRKFSVSIQAREVTDAPAPGSPGLSDAVSRVVIEETADAPPEYNTLFKNDYKISPPLEKQPDRSQSNPFWTKNMEINLPAWMFLQLVPFYTNSNAASKTGLAVPKATTEFATTRPVVGICLKRSEWSASNQATLNTREIVVPQVIKFPSFVADDEEDHPNSYVLVLESVIFHKGKSTQSGHFISLMRENGSMGYKNSQTEKLSSNSRWVLFDDLLAPGEKVKPVDFDQVFHNEKPYILFYRLVTARDYEREMMPPAQPKPTVQQPNPEITLTTLDSTAVEFVDEPVSSSGEPSRSSSPGASLLQAGSRFLGRGSSKTRSSSAHSTVSRSPSPLRHSMDDSRAAAASARRTGETGLLSTLRSDDGGSGSSSRFRRSKSMRHRSKGKSHRGGDSYQDEKCSIQ